MTVILEMPFVYTAQAVMGRDRTAKPRRLIGAEAVSVEEIAASEARVVALLPTGKGDYLYLKHGDRLLRPFPVGNGIEVDTVLPAPTVGEAIDYTHDWRKRAAGRADIATWNFGPKAERLPTCTDEREFGARRYLKDNRDDSAASMRAIMADARIVDGRVYVPTDGPAITAHVSCRWVGGMDAAEKYQVLSEVRIIPDIGWADFSIRGHTDLLPAHDMEGALALVELLRDETIAKNQSDVSPGARDAERGLIVLDPSAMPDVSGQGLRMAISGTFHQLGSGLHRFDGAGLRSFADLKDALESGADTPTLHRLAVSLDGAFRRVNWSAVLNIVDCSIGLHLRLEARRSHALERLQAAPQLR